MDVFTLFISLCFLVPLPSLAQDLLEGEGRLREVCKDSIRNSDDNFAPALAKALGLTGAEDELCGDGRSNLSCEWPWRIIHQ